MEIPVHWRQDTKRTQNRFQPKLRLILRRYLQIKRTDCSVLLSSNETKSLFFIVC